MAKITGDMTIAQVIEKYPSTVKILMSMGIHCLGCPSATAESIREAAMVHGQDPDEFLKKLNEAV
ncbi:MAG: DUF1858 domain-containing protein [Firmicutes bacterium]|nr:DUF1858 domain-containing protein [Bacillota bacterium]